MCTGNLLFGISMLSLLNPTVLEAKHLGNEVSHWGLLFREMCKEGKFQLLLSYQLDTENNDTYRNTKFTFHFQTIYVR